MIKKEVRRMRQNFIYNWKTLILFELLYKLCSILIFTPLLRMAFSGIMKLTGNGFITSENFKSFAQNPLTIILVVILLLLMSAYVMIDISAIIYIYDQSEQKVHVSLRQVLLFASKNGIRAFSLKNCLIAVIVLFMIPFLNIGMAFSFVGTIRLPDLWQHYIDSHLWLQVLVAMGILLIVYFLLHWLYAFHYFTLEKSPFRLARGQSRRLCRRHKWAGLITLMLIQLLFYLLYLAISSLGVFLIVLIQKAVALVSIPSAIFISVIAVFLSTLMLLLTAIVVPISYLIISTLFYYLKEKEGEEVYHIKADNYNLTKRRKKQLYIVQLFILCVAVIGCSYYTFGLAQGRYALNIENFKTGEVTAHRGAAQYYPENSMAAFRGARQQGADWIELDVHESKDGVLFIYHDDDFQRLMGEDKQCNELTYAQIKKLHFTDVSNDKYKKETIPTLETVLKYAKWNHLKVNIELKTDNSQTDIEEKTIALIEKYYMQKEVGISSADYKTIVKVKKLAPQLQTIYITTIAYGDVTKLDDVDVYSVEASSVSRALVHNIHTKGKEIFVWTVNDENCTEEMINDGVDNIITDDVPTAKKLIYAYRGSALFGEYVEKLLK